MTKTLENKSIVCIYKMFHRKNKRSQLNSHVLKKRLKIECTTCSINFEKLCISYIILHLFLKVRFSKVFTLIKNSINVYNLILLYTFQ